MLGTRNAVANLAVSDLNRARRFYGDNLGLKQIDSEGDDFAVFRSGDSDINVYRSEFAGTNEATAVTWNVDDLDAEVSALRSKGVTFEHYDLPGLEVRGDVHVGEEGKMAWFKDPGGNILHVVETVREPA
ncbi:VOC family protein [Sphingosinicella sp.]|uniref:VOC family protein n=1 Tax=Sphingosinicella sp. TaxID=1917971 RepID=UPI004037DB28